jgi:hypothetical protein
MFCSFAALFQHPPRFARSLRQPSSTAKVSSRRHVYEWHLIRPSGFAQVHAGGENDAWSWRRISGRRRQQPERCDERHPASILGLTFETVKALLSERLAFVPKPTLRETVQPCELPRIEAPGSTDRGFYEFRPCVSGGKNSKLPIGGTGQASATTSIFRAANAYGSNRGTCCVPTRPASVSHTSHSTSPCMHRSPSLYRWFDPRRRSL